MSIASEITRLQTAKSDIKISIENKGVTIPSNEKIDNYSDYIDEIETGGQGTDDSDATLNSNSQLLSGVTAYAKGTKYTGSMENKGSKTFTPSTTVQTATAGYYSDITVNAISTGALSTPTINTSTGVVTASVGTSGYLASGTNKTLQLSTQPAQTITPTTNNQIIESGKYLTGTQTISGDTNLVAGNIKKDVTIFGVTGTHEGGGSATLITKSITQNGTYNASSDNADGYSSVTVSVSGGIVEPEEKDVNFYDYDGTRVYSYTKAEFLALESLPENPSHTGLTAQGWNWSLSNAQTYVTTYGELDIGQNYITSDNKTKIKIKVEECGLKPYLGLGGVNGSIEVNWGDGSGIETITGSSISTPINTLHTYSNTGNYTIEINPINDSTFRIHGFSSVSYLLNDNNTTGSVSIYQSYITDIFCGKNIIFGSHCFSYLKNLKKISIPTKISSCPAGFAYNDVNTIVIPQGITTLGQFGDSRAKHILIPNGVSTLPRSFLTGVSNLRKLIIPSSVKTIETYMSTSLGADIIVMPSSITSMKSYAFQGAKAGEIKGYTYCNNNTDSGSNYLNCKNLKKIKLKPCSSMPSRCFEGCTSLELIDCSEFTSIPTANVSNVFSGVPNTCKLIVPASLYESWSSNSSWSSAFDIISA